MEEKEREKGKGMKRRKVDCERGEAEGSQSAVAHSVAISLIHQKDVLRKNKLLERWAF